MNKTKTLLKAQIINFFPINEIKKRGNTQGSRIIVGLGVITLTLFIGVYNTMIAKTLVRIGQQELIPAYMVSVSSFCILFITIFYSNGILFGSKDIDMLLSLPVTNNEIISSKFFLMYLLNFLITFLFMIPGGVIWLISIKARVLQILFYFISVLFVPLIPMCIATCMGILIILVSSFFKNKNTISLIFSFVMFGFIGCIAVYSMQSGNNLNNIEFILAKQITAIYPLSKVFMKNSFFSLSVGMGFFIVISMIVYYLFVKNVSLRYDLLISLSKTTPRYSSHKKINKRSSPFIALYKKELGRYLNSYMVVLNTGLGIVLLIIFSLVLLVSSPQQISEYVKIQNINEVFSNYAPVYIASMLILSCPATSSISLEGKNAWIMQSSPISMDMILKSKLAVNFTLHALGYIVSIFVFTIKVNMDMIQYIRLLIIPICYSIFITVLGIALNKKYPNYGWNNEMIVVKQSVPVILSGVIGMIALATPVMIIWFFHVPIGITLWVTAFILLVSAIIIYSKASKSKYI